MLQTPCQPVQLPPVPGAWQYLEHGQSLEEACSWSEGTFSHGNEGEERDCHLSGGKLSQLGTVVWESCLCYHIRYLTELSLAAPTIASTFLVRMRLRELSLVSS